VEQETVFILLVVVASAVAILGRRPRVPYTVALGITGLSLGSAHAFAAPHLTKQLLFTVCLPGLLFEAAFHMVEKDRALELGHDAIDQHTAERLLTDIDSRLLAVESGGGHGSTRT
jgi:hypothetical protein